jgi:TRAP-type uncharacterized transport system fused permease subunit
MAADSQFVWSALGVAANILAILLPHAVVTDKSPSASVTHHLYLADDTGANDLSRASTWSRTVRWLSALLIATNVFQIWLRTFPTPPISSSHWVFCTGCVLSTVIGTLVYPFLAHLTYIDGGDYGVDTAMSSGAYVFVAASLSLPLERYASIKYDTLAASKKE